MFDNGREAGLQAIGLRLRDHPRDLGKLVGVLARGVGGQLLHRDPPVLTVMADSTVALFGRLMTSQPSAN